MILFLTVRVILDGFPSGQRGQTVNLLRFASVVRIHPPPPRRSKRHIVCSDFFIKSQNALILLLLLSKSQPLRWVVICCRRLAAFFDCGKRSGLNGACRKRWSQTGSQFSFQRERRPFAGAPVAGRPVRGDGHRQRPFGRKSRK